MQEAFSPQPDSGQEAASRSLESRKQHNEDPSFEKAIDNTLNGIDNLLGDVGEWELGSGIGEGLLSKLQSALTTLREEHDQEGESLDEAQDQENIKISNNLRQQLEKAGVKLKQPEKETKLKPTMYYGRGVKKFLEARGFDKGRVHFENHIDPKRGKIIRIQPDEIPEGTVVTSINGSPDARDVFSRSDVSRFQSVNIEVKGDGRTLVATGTKPDGTRSEIIMQFPE
jgi:hypothetical protein